MSILENPLFIIDNGALYATEYLIPFIWGVYLAIVLITLLGSFLPCLMRLTSRFARYVSSKIKSKRKEK